MRHRLRLAFSLIELLIVVGVIGIVVGLTLPAIQNARASATRTECLNHLHQIGLAMHLFHDAHGRLPPLPLPNVDILTQPPENRSPNTSLGWMALILPEMEQQPLYESAARACLLDPNSCHNPPHTGLASVVKSYTCPADGRLTGPLTDSSGVTAGYTSYIGIDGVFDLDTLTSQPGAMRATLASITDGTSNTIMVGERPPPDNLQAGWWYPVFHGTGMPERGPNNTLLLGEGALAFSHPCGDARTMFGPGSLDNPCDRFHLWSLHPGGANFLFADGSARFLGYSAAPLIPALATRSGGEPPPDLP